MTPERAHGQLEVVASSYEQILEPGRYTLSGQFLATTRQLRNWYVRQARNLGDLIKDTAEAGEGPTDIDLVPASALVAGQKILHPDHRTNWQSVTRLTRRPGAATSVAYYVDDSREGFISCPADWVPFITWDES